VRPLHEWVGSAAAQQLQVDESQRQFNGFAPNRDARLLEVASSLGNFTENRWKTRMAPRQNGDATGTGGPKRAQNRLTGTRLLLNFRPEIFASAHSQSELLLPATFGFPANLRYLRIPKAILPRNPHI
jgi:hypothetical protein